MKKCGAIVCLLFAVLAVAAQKIQYSRQTLPHKHTGALQLVTNVGGSHHLLSFNEGKKPDVFVFNAGLQLQAETKIDVEPRENSDVIVVAFATHYFVYIHVPGSPEHRLFRVENDGASTDVSERLSADADSLWNRSTATFQLVGDSGRLKIIAHTYYHAFKQVYSRIVSFDDDLRIRYIRTVFFPFDRSKETLQQAKLAGPHLFLLKTSRDDENGSVLNLLKLHVPTGDLLWKTFATGSRVYSQPGMRYNPADSSMLLHSVVHEVSGRRLQRVVLLAHLNHELQDLTPVRLLRTPFRSHLIASFVLPSSAAGWLPYVNYSQFYRGFFLSSMPDFDPAMPNRTRIATYRMLPYNRTPENSGPSSVALTVLNDRFDVQKDSVVANKGTFYDLQPQPFAQLVLNRKPSLLFIENFTSKKRGLLLVTSGEQNDVSVRNVSVYDRYDYFLPLAQAVDDKSFLLPYTHKKELGLVKITVDD